MSLEDKISGRILRGLEQRFLALQSDLEAVHKSRNAAERQRTEKLLAFIGEQLNANVSAMLRDTVHQELRAMPSSSSMAAQPSDVMAALRTAVSDCMASQLVPALTTAVASYLGRCEGLFASSLQQARPDLVVPSLPDASSLQANKAKLEACLAENNHQEALLRACYLHQQDPAFFVDVLRRLPTVPQLADLCFARLADLISVLDTRLSACEEDPAAAQLLFAWLEEALIALDVARERSPGPLLLPVPTVLSSVLTGLQSRSTALFRLGISEKAVRLNIRLVQSILNT